jgi:hypothetical protein
MTPEERKMLQETYALVRDSNKMLHASRRNAFLGGMLKIAMYAAFIIIPGYYFMTSVLPSINKALEKVNSVNQSMNQVGQSGVDLQNKVQPFVDKMNDFKKMIGQ